MTDSKAQAESVQNDRVQQIIAKGQKARPGGWGTSLVVGLTALLTWSAFFPLDWGPLGWICLAPLLLLVRLPQRRSWMYCTIYLGAFCYWIVSLQWMRLGDPAMYLGLLALSFYLAFYWPAFIALTRIAVWRFRIPMLLAAPVIWTGFDFLRAYVFTGFSWYYLGHTQHNWVEVIQISDIFGAYGVTFLVVMANAALAEAVPETSLQRLFPVDSSPAEVPRCHRRPFRAVAVSIGLVIISLGYGYFRMSQSQFQAGPRMAMIQGNFVASLKPDDDQWEEIYQTHHYLTGQTVPHQPDVIVWPEAMFRFPMFERDDMLTDDQLNQLHPMIPAEAWRSDSSQKTLAEISDKTDAALIVGVNTYIAHAGHYDLFNAAAFVQPGKGIRSRYDKIHRVPFGEYIPLKKSLPFLQSLTPFRGKFGIDAGKSLKVFEHKDWRMIPLICFEDTVPHLVRQMVKSASQNGQQPVDVLINASNDGWFHGSSELDQHLITSSFRAVETRTPVVRAANTGISAFIDGDGVIREPKHLIDLDALRDNTMPKSTMRDAKTGRFHRQFNGALIADVPLDDRSSLYVRFGDWFAALCLISTFMLIITSMLLKNKTVESESSH